MLPFLRGASRSNFARAINPRVVIGILADGPLGLTNELLVSQALSPFFGRMSGPISRRLHQTFQHKYIHD